MYRILLEDAIRYAKCFFNEHGPVDITLPDRDLSYDVGNYRLYIQPIIPAEGPEYQFMAYFNGFKCSVPVNLKNIVKDSRNRMRL